MPVIALLQQWIPVKPLCELVVQYAHCLPLRDLHERLDALYGPRYDSDGEEYPDLTCCKDYETCHRNSDRPPRLPCSPAIDDRLRDGQRPNKVYDLRK